MAKKGIVTLREIRKAKDMTLEDVSRAGGPKAGSYARVDSGKAEPENMTVKTLMQLCYAFQMTPEELLTTIGLDWKEKRE
jgi:transcriptional regulator with XRE-family HTH domain